MVNAHWAKELLKNFFCAGLSDLAFLEVLVA